MSKQRVGQKTYIDVDTGEYVYADQIIDNYFGGKPFWKVYLENLMPLIRKYNGKQKDILCHIIEHIKPSENSYEGTYKKLVKETGACEATVAKTMSSLQDDGFITIKSLGVWRVNPEVLMKGSESKRKELSKDFKKFHDDRSAKRKKEDKQECKEEPSALARKINQL